jgi:ABC-2 type transport system ATP-binding protein
MEQWDLTDKRDASFANLSGGQRQRLLVALALVNDPEVVFLDEMTTGLDPAARRVAWDLIRAIQERGTTVVLVTHFMEEAEALCDRVAIVDQGRVVALDTPQGLIANHANGIRVRFSTKQDDLTWLKAVPHVNGVTRHNGRVEVEGNGPVLALVAAALVERGLTPLDLRVEQPTLEDVFLRITGRPMGE